MKKSNTTLILLSAGILMTSIGAVSAHATTLVKENKTVQIKQPTKSIANHKTGGLIQSVSPAATVSSELQTRSRAGNSLGTSGATENSNTKIVGASSLPSLWNPLNPSSGNYKQTTPVLDQKDLSICWDYAGVDAISVTAKKQLHVSSTLLPAYYDYLSAGNAFKGTTNPLAVMDYSDADADAAGDVRQLGDGNTLDYVPEMSLIGYNPAFPGAGLTQNMTLSQDIPVAQATFNSLAKSNLHVKDTYRLPGLYVNQLPTTTSSIMNRVNQIKQLVYQYGEVQFGTEAEYSMDYDMIGKGALSSQVTSKGDYTSYTPYSVAKSANANYSYDNSRCSGDYPLLTNQDAYSGQDFVVTDHEMQIVGYDDNYSAANFKQNLGMNGAFIVKNSWGSNWGNGGYFYLSYADVFVAASEIFADSVTTTQAGQKTYSATNTTPEAAGTYYEFGNDANDLSPTNNNLFANTYTSQNEPSNKIEQLSSVSAYIDQPGVKVNVLYKAGGVSSSTKVSDFKNLGSYTFTDSGYQTIPVSPVNLPNHGAYTIALRVTNMTSYKALDMYVQNLNDAGSGQYPVLTSKNSWIELDNQWENLSESDEANLYLDANTQQANAVTVTFNSNGGSAVASQKVLSGKTIAQPATPTRSGYEFAGWYSDKGLSHSYNFSSPVSGNITLYAKWKATPKVPLYRIFNPNSGAHVYTESSYEAQQDAKVGWQYQGIAWYAPKTGGVPVYRLYNPNSGEHFYTESSYERNSLVKVGWRYENVSFNVAQSGLPIYRLYNAKVTAGSHFYTASLSERNSYMKNGWTYEGLAWYGVK